MVSRAWRKVRTDWKAWNGRELHNEDIVRLILDGIVVRAKIDRTATAIPLLVAIGVRRNDQKVLLALRNMGGESTAAWTAFLESMTRRGPITPGFVIVDGAPGLETALAALWPDVPVQRCSVHKHRNLPAHAPKRLHDELTNDSRDIIYADTAADVEARHKAYLRVQRRSELARPVPSPMDVTEADHRLSPGIAVRQHERGRRRVDDLPCLERPPTSPSSGWCAGDCR